LINRATCHPLVSQFFLSLHRLYVALATLLH
jgi:hypothetical protein